MRRTLSRFKVIRGVRRPRVHGARERGGTLLPPVQFLLILRWSARATSVLVLGLVGIFLAGHRINSAALTPTDWILMLFLLWSLVGLILAWRWPLRGGGLSLVGLAGFFALEWISTGHPPSGWVFPALAVPGALFLASSRFAEREPSA